MKIISSRTNPVIKHIVSLHSKKGRRAHKQFIAEGVRTCSSLIAQKQLPEALYITENHLSDTQKLISDEGIVIVSPHVMEKISITSTPSGIVGVFSIPPTPAPDQLQAGLVLAQISDPGNMGTLIRTAAAMGIASVVVIEGADPFSPKVVQASAGTLGMVTIFELSWEQLLAYKKDKTLCALIVSGGKPPQQIDFTHSLIIVGSEAHGIPDSWIADCDEKLTLPMPGKAESLNAAVAGSIALYLAYSK